MLERLSDENNNNNPNSFPNNNNFGESLPDPATILEELHHIQVGTNWIFKNGALDHTP